MEGAKYAAEDYLAHFPPEQRGVILLGALAGVYRKENDGADTAVWLAESKEEVAKSLRDIGSSSIAHQTIDVLRELAVLDDIIATKAGLVVYPADAMKELNV